MIKSTEWGTVFEDTKFIWGRFFAPHNAAKVGLGVASRSDAGQDDDDHPNHPHPEPYHQLAP